MPENEWQAQIQGYFNYQIKPAPERGGMGAKVIHTRKLPQM